MSCGCPFTRAHFFWVYVQRARRSGRAVAGCGCAAHRKCAGLETLERGVGGGAQAAVEGEPFSVKGLVRAVDAVATVELVIAGDVPVGIHAVYPMALLLPARPRIGMSTFARWRMSTVQSGPSAQCQCDRRRRCSRYS